MRFLGHKSIGEIQGLIVPIEELRSRLKILVIDNEPFRFLDVIKTHGFKITQEYDITRIQEAADYDLIICDIRDVGTRISEKGQGAYVASEIKRIYPDKYVCIYTSGNLLPKFQKLAVNVDAYYSIRWDTDEWVENLDLAARILTHPYSRWMRTRIALLNKGVSLRQLIKLEDKFVRSVKNGNKEAYENFARKKFASNNNQILTIAMGVTQIILGVAAL